MLLSLNWLREFVHYEGDGAELGRRLTMAGLEMEGISRPYAALKSIVTGHVLECARHPEADKLAVCRVDVGSEVLDIVCGAPNVAAGQKVAVVKAGSALPSGLVIKKTKLRGVPSNGMICSESELGLSEEHDGILVLPGAVKIGLPLTEALKLDDEILDISITPNRGDCLSVLGLAREAAAILGLPLHLPVFSRRVDGLEADGELSVAIPDPDLCPLYHGLLIENVKSAPSPGWLRYRLNAVGVRPISNLVDVTNYVMLELGQPLHAFDLEKIRGEICVRAADAGEIFTTLDGKQRVLNSSDITIRDERGVICLGGIMGGLNSEITDTTSKVFLESAIFNPANIRKSARRLNLHSEASFRFERGVDQGGATFALERAAHLMAIVADGHVRPGLIKNEARPLRRKRIRLRMGFTQERLGVSIQSSFYEKTLRSLGCSMDDASGDLRFGENNPSAQWDVTPPSHRQDLRREIDLVEEVIRIYGVDRIPAQLPNITRILDDAGRPLSKTAFQSRVKHWARGVSLNEIITYSFVGHRELEILDIPVAKSIRIMNPLSDDLDVLRPHLVPGLLNALRNNLAQNAPSVRLFETAATFAADETSETGAKEEARLGIILHGARQSDLWPHSPGDLDYLDLKGLIEHLLQSLLLPEANFVTAQGDSYPWLSPAVDIILAGDKIGFAGRVKTGIADRYLTRKDAWTAEINLDILHSLHKKSKILFQSLPTFPPARRDITFISPLGLRADAILESIARMRSPLAVEARLIDCYEPQGTNERNLTFRFTFRRADRTLKDAEADKQRDLIVETVQKTLGVRV
ncbi:MAG: phenylalanine--tRNA ligase subunit beta [Desulfovibrio sp.]|jgi:phenylalanyl-tRNA synthetase beta chain|nr:phenylalanine--tRNA ligase subunit beta [Desulfovibrio sp.]